MYFFQLSAQPKQMADPEKAMEVENDHEDIDDEEVDGQNAKSTMAAELLKNPAMFAALQVKVQQHFITPAISNFSVFKSLVYPQRSIFYQTSFIIYKGVSFLNNILD